MPETSAPIVTDLSQVLLWFDHSTASLLSLGMQPIDDPNLAMANPLEPLVVAVGSQEAIQQLYDFHYARRPIAAIIAWRLTEAQTMSLYGVGRPVLIGQPSHVKLLGAINDQEWNAESAAADRRFAADLAVREALFNKPRPTEGTLS